MGDLIDRQAAIDIASGYCHPASITKELAALPSAQPERKKGRWILGGIEEESTHLGSRWYECNQCHTPGDIQDNFCRGCGCDMRQEGGQ